MQAPAEPEPAGRTVVVRALDLRGEVVEIANTGDAPIDIGGWKLHDEGSTKGFAFPAGTVLEAGASVRVRSGPGAAKTGPRELKWKTANVWNNKGDTDGNRSHVACSAQHQRIVAGAQRPRHAERHVGGSRPAAGRAAPTSADDGSRLRSSGGSVQSAHFRL